MHLFHFISLAIAGLLLVTSATAAERPNFVLILADDLGYGDVGYQGGDVPTPNIDSIAKGGTIFTDGYVTCPVCAPSRAGLLTGRYQQSFGFWDNIGPFRRNKDVEPGIPTDLPILSEHLKELGYTTGIFGKTHDGDAEEQMAFNRWDEFYGFNNGAANYLGDMNRAHNPIFHNRKIVSSPYKERGIAHDQVIKKGVIIKDADQYFTDQLGDMAARFIDANRDRPFLCYVPFNAIHGPFQATKALVDKYANEPDEKRRLNKAMLDSMDQNIGKVLAVLKRNSLEENTLVVFLSDNGGHEASPNKPLRGKKGTYWEGGLRVPFAMQWKGRLPAGAIYRHPVISLDILPTFLAAAGQKIDPAWKLDGTNLLPFVTGQNQERPHDTLYWVWGARKAIRQGDLKAVSMNGGRDYEMFDLSKDIGESDNLASAASENLRTLIKKHQAWEAKLMPQQWGWNSALGYRNPNFGKPKPYHAPGYFSGRPVGLRLNSIFTDHMVLQRNRPIPVYGTGKPGAKIEVQLGRDKVLGTIGRDGKWELALPARKATARSLRLLVRSNGEEKKLSDILIGDVWVCSGQSNMGWELANTSPLPTDYPHADKLRLVRGAVTSDPQPQENFVIDTEKFTEQWERATEANALRISAVSYHMGAEIVARTGVPVGIVVAALGGSQIWPWMTPASFADHPEAAMAREASKRSWDWAQGQSKRLAADGQKERAERLLHQYKAKAPSSLYHGMLHPLIRMPIAGMLWYQGERSQDNPPPYRSLFPAAIKGWRQAWGQGDFPFVFIQLPGYHGGTQRNELRARGFPLVREAQELALELPHTGMAMALEFGNYADVHPRVKNEVGRRAALQALRLTGSEVIADGPIRKRIELKGSTALIHFDSVADGLETRRVVMARTARKTAGDDPDPAVVRADNLEGFEVAGLDGKFKPASARIVAPNRVQLRARGVQEIVHIRYAFAPFPECNLFNSAGLPARPFRTDDFPVPFGTE